MIMSKRKGMTLVELVCAVACLMLLMMVVMNVFRVGVFGGEIGTKEFDQQTAFRVATEKITNQVRYSTALFILPQSSFNAANLSGANRDIYLSEYWNYFGLVETTVRDAAGAMVSATQVVEYIWDDTSGTHKENIVVPARADMTYELVFSKRNEEDVADKNIEFLVKATHNTTGETYFLVESESQALNSLQVVNWAGGASPGVAIAYRADDRERGSRGGSGKVLAIVDISGSMNGHRNALRTALTNLIDGLQAKGSIEFAIVPFGWTANLSESSFEQGLFISNGGFAASTNDDILGYLPAGGGPRQFKFFSLNDPDEFKIIKAYAAAISTGGNTNTGDGIRRAYEAFEADGAGALSTMKNFVILLVDGDTNMGAIDPYNPLNPTDIRLREAPGDIEGRGSINGIRYNIATQEFEMTFNNNSSTWYTRSQAASMHASNSSLVPSIWIGSQSNTMIQSIVGSYDPTGAGVFPIETRPNTRYIELHANRLTRDFQVNAHIIAYTNGVASTTITNIKNSFSTNGMVAETYAAADADGLIAVFDQITQTIINDPWFIDGPNQLPTPIAP